MEQKAYDSEIALGRRVSKKKSAAIKVLVELGFFAPFDREQGYVHVRALKGEKAGEWAPNPEWIPKMSNVNSYANVYANHSSNTEGIDEMKNGMIGESESINLTTDSENYYILNRDFDVSKLSPEDTLRYQEALKTLGLAVGATEISKLTPADFKARDYYAELYSLIMQIFASAPAVERFELKLREGYVSKGLVKPEYITMQMMETAIDEFCSSHHISDEAAMAEVKKTAQKIAGAINARTLLLKNPSKAIKLNAELSGRLDLADRRNYLFISQDSVLENGSKINEKMPFSPEYVSAWLEESRVIGMQTSTIGERGKAEGQPVYVFIDLDRVNSEAVIGRRIAAIINTYESLPEEFRNLEVLSMGNTIRTLPTELKEADCKKVIELLRPYILKVNKESLLDMPSGVWEGYTVGEHTEAVLRVFETTFEPSIPTELLPLMKLALVVHDIGKGLAVAQVHDRGRQKEFTEQVCAQLFSHENMRLSPTMVKAIMFMIGESQDFTTAYYVKKDPAAREALYQKCLKFLQENFNINDAGAAQALLNMCLIIQNCDSISYTQYGVVRGTQGKGEGIYYRGGNEAWGRGVESVGFDKRKKVLRRPTVTGPGEADTSTLRIEQQDGQREM